jgi:hypothetical protein
MTVTGPSPRSNTGSGQGTDEPSPHTPTTET